MYYVCMQCMLGVEFYLRGGVFTLLLVSEMVRLFCKCLNVQLGHNSDISSARKIAIDQLYSNVTDELSGTELTEVKLDIGGVIIVSM